MPIKSVYKVIFNKHLTVDALSPPVILIILKKHVLYIYIYIYIYLDILGKRGKTRKGKVITMSPRYQSYSTRLNK
jgi:hypothetical protein